MPAAYPSPHDLNILVGVDEWLEERFACALWTICTFCRIPALDARLENPSSQMVVTNWLPSLRLACLSKLFPWGGCCMLTATWSHRWEPAVRSGPRTTIYPDKGITAQTSDSLYPPPPQSVNMIPVMLPWFTAELEACQRCFNVLITDDCTCSTVLTCSPFICKLSKTCSNSHQNVVACECGESLYLFSFCFSSWVIITPCWCNVLPPKAKR